MYNEIEKFGVEIDYRINEMMINLEIRLYAVVRMFVTVW